MLPAETSTFFTGDKAYFVAPAGTVDILAKMLERRLAIGESVPRAVIDAMRLEGKYDLKFSALESQLGLKLQPKKSAPVGILVIDHIERTPTDN